MRDRLEALRLMYLKVCGLRMNKIIEKIKGDTWYVLNKKRAFDVIISTILINFGKLAFPAYIYICYTKLQTNKSLALMIFATALIILIVVITSFLENLRQNILRKEKQIVAAEERTKDCEKYLSKKVNKSDVDKLIELNGSALTSLEPDYDLVVIGTDLIFALAICMIIINIGGGAIIFSIGILKAITTKEKMNKIFNQYATNKNHQKYKYEKIVSYSRIQETVNSMRVNNFEQIEVDGYERMQTSSSIERYNDNLLISKNKNLEAFTSKLDIMLVATIGTFLVIGDLITAAKLGACILLITRCIQPWNNFVQIFARYTYLYKFELDDAGISKAQTSYERLTRGSELEYSLNKSEILIQNTSSNKGSFKLTGKTINSLKDKNYGVDVRKFCESMFDGHLSSIRVNNTNLSEMDVEDVSKHVKMIDLSLPIIETNLLDALCCLEIEQNRRLALYLTYISGLSEKIKELEYGYEANVHNDIVKGMSSDDILVIKVIQSLASDPELLIIDIRNIIFGRDFVNYMDKILRDRDGKLTIILNTNGGIIDSKAKSIVNILEGDKIT